MQLWMEINAVTLRKVVETMPQQMRSVIQAKGGSTKRCDFYIFLARQCITMQNSIIVIVFSKYVMNYHVLIIIQ